MKGAVAFAVLALAASANAQSASTDTITSCQQGTQQIAQLQQQISATQNQAAQCAAGGAIEPYNPMWAPWPIHAWPDAGTAPCMKLQAHSTFIQTANDAAVVTINQEMAALNC